MSNYTPEQWLSMIWGDRQGIVRKDNPMQAGESSADYQKRLDTIVASITTDILSTMRSMPAWNAIVGIPPEVVRAAAASRESLQALQNTIDQYRDALRLQGATSDASRARAIQMQMAILPGGLRPAQGIDYRQQKGNPSMNANTFRGLPSGQMMRSRPAAQAAPPAPPYMSVDSSTWLSWLDKQRKDYVKWHFAQVAQETNAAYAARISDIVARMTTNALIDAKKARPAGQADNYDFGTGEQAAREADDLQRQQRQQQQQQRGSDYASSGQNATDYIFGGNQPGGGDGGGSKGGGSKGGGGGGGGLSQQSIRDITGGVAAALGVAGQLIQTAMTQADSRERRELEARMESRRLELQQQQRSSDPSVAAQANEQLAQIAQIAQRMAEAASTPHREEEGMSTNTKLLIGGGVAVVLIGGIAFMMMRTRKNPSNRYNPTIYKSTPRGLRRWKRVKR